MSEKSTDRSSEFAVNENCKSALFIISQNSKSPKHSDLCTIFNELRVRAIRRNAIAKSQIIERNVIKIR